MAFPRVLRSRLLAFVVIAGVVLASVVVAGLTLASVVGPKPAPAAGQDAALDLSHYDISFEDDFDDLDIAARSGGRWSAHTPWNGDFGDATFTDPGPTGPFTHVPTGLRITAKKDESGHWRSGLICSIDQDGPQRHGFSQQYGYFEMRAKLPTGMGVWPAFWLIGVDKAKSSAEIDVIEFYGGFPGYYHSWGHIFVGGRDLLALDHLTSVPAGSLSNDFNDYGVLVDPQDTRLYLNRRLIWSFPTPDEFRQPMYILADLAIGGGWPIDKLSSPQAMDIQYIRVYKAKPGNPAGGTPR
jgi:hypothetical protein